MSIQAVMTANPACCSANTALQQVAALMVEHDCGQIPVIDDARSQQLIGVITDRDIAVRMIAKGKNPLDGVAGDCMSTPCISVNSDSSLADCCAVMESNRIRRVPVVDDHGRLCGIVSLADVARCADAASTAEVIKEVSAAN